MELQQLRMVEQLVRPAGTQLLLLLLVLLMMRMTEMMQRLMTSMMMMTMTTMLDKVCTCRHASFVKCQK